MHRSAVRIAAIKAIALVGFVLIAALSLIPHAGAASLELGKMQTQMLSPSVQLNENCSGTLILSEKDAKGVVTNLVLTAKHCVTGSPFARQSVDIPVYRKLRVVKAERYYGKVLGQAAAADLALVKLDDTETVFANVAKVAGEAPELVMGEDTWTVGYPQAEPLTITAGKMGSIEYWSTAPADGYDFIRATQDIAPGNSGGGMFHKTPAGDFELIGVTSFMNRQFSFMAYYVAPSSVYAYLKVAAPAAVGLKPPVKTAKN